MKHYDYLIVGSGLFGATFAHRAKKAGKESLVIDKRPYYPVNDERNNQLAGQYRAFATQDNDV